MGRPSVKAERRDQILDAYEACVARYGVHGASLERIAETAGLARALIRHNVGNREDLLEALVDRFLLRTEQDLAQAIASLPGTDAANVLVDWLFDPSYADAQTVLVAEALIAASQEDRQLAERMRAWTRRFIAELRAVFAATYPRADAGRLDDVAAGVTGIYFNVDSLTPLGAMTDVRSASRRAARLLISLLEHPR